MRLGDNPDLRRLARDDDDTKCPRCGGPKSPGFKLCRDCARDQRGGDRTRDQAPSKLPPKLVLDTFYGPTGKLKPELFFELPQQLAGLLGQARPRPSKTGLRSLFQTFRDFAGLLAEGSMDFDTARERFGQFYVERVVRQVTRGFLPPIVQDFFDQHRELALSDQREMLGLFEYLKNTLCYFDEKEEERQR